MSKIRAAMEMMKNLPGRGQEISKQVLGNPGRRQEMMGRNIPGRGLTGSLRPVPSDISKAQALGMTTAMGGLGGLAVSDLTEGFTESAKLSNSIFADPEELGRRAAKAKMTLEEIFDAVKGKAEELGEAPQVYMLKVQSGYEDEMNQAIQRGEIDFGSPIVDVISEGGQTINIHKDGSRSVVPKFQGDDEGIQPVSIFMSNGGEASFPDLSGDGKITRKDILIGQGVEFAEGGEAEMQMSEQEAMAELESVAPEAKMVEQLVMAVMQMIQQGVSEEDVRAFLKEQGLDDEDIEDLFMIVMQQIEQGPTEEPIGQELQGMM